MLFTSSHKTYNTDKQGDKICIFGFSRGAYTARALAGMVHKVVNLVYLNTTSAHSARPKVGLLPAFNSQQVPFAYKVYKKDSAKGTYPRTQACSFIVADILSNAGWRQSVLFVRDSVFPVVSLD